MKQEHVDNWAKISHFLTPKRSVEKCLIQFVKFN